MKNLRFMFLLPPCFLFVSGVYADSKVETIHISLNNPKVARISISGAPASVKPECSTNVSWDYAFDFSTDTGKAFYSMLLSAHATGASFKISGKGVCDVVSAETIEALNWIWLQ